MSAPAPLKIGITCYPSVGGSGILASALGEELARLGHEVHFISYERPFRMPANAPRLFFHPVDVSDYGYAEGDPALAETALARPWPDVMPSDECVVVDPETLETGNTEMFPVLPVPKPRWTPPLGRTIVPKAARDHVAGEIIVLARNR